MKMVVMLKKHIETRLLPSSDRVYNVYCKIILQTG